MCWWGVGREPLLTDLPYRGGVADVGDIRCRLHDIVQGATYGLTRPPGYAISVGPGLRGHLCPRRCHQGQRSPVRRCRLCRRPSQREQSQRGLGWCWDSVRLAGQSGFSRMVASSWLKGVASRQTVCRGVSIRQGNRVKEKKGIPCCSLNAANGIARCARGYVCIHPASVFDAMSARMARSWG